MAKKLTNPWIRTYQRSYQSIKAQLLEDLANIKDDDGNQLVTDLSDGNILVIILSMFAIGGRTRTFFLSHTFSITFSRSSHTTSSPTKMPWYLRLPLATHQRPLTKN